MLCYVLSQTPPMVLFSFYICKTIIDNSNIKNSQQSFNYSYSISIEKQCNGIITLDLLYQ